MEMESSAAWAGPYEFQLAKNWTAEVAPADDADQVWDPAVGHPLQYASIADIFSSSCSLQPYVVPATASGYSGEGQQQLVEYNYYNHNYTVASQVHHDSHLLDTYMKDPEKPFQERYKEFSDDAKLLKTKMHRYPPSIQALGDWCTVPKVVAIGPYYHRRNHRLQKAEKMKHVAAHYCIEDYKKVNYSGLSVVQDIYGAVVYVASKINARGLYDKEVMAGMDDENEFLPMMFYDACFLVMYMVWTSVSELMLNTSGDKELHNFFKSNEHDILHDIMLLENQIPLQVVDAVMNKCTSQPLQIKKTCIATWRKDGFLQDRADRELPGVDRDQDYYTEAPHLLGLFRFYAVGERRSRNKDKDIDFEKMKSISISASAIELAEMGISLSANKTMELLDMGLDSNWIIFGELSMAPLSLDDARANRLVNMAALELCTTPDFFATEAEFEDSAVCSYLLLLCMLMHREEDVHELRTKGILQGAGLTNKKTLDFFTSLQNLPFGLCYGLVMVHIQNYKNKKPWMIEVHKFVYNNRKYIVAGVSFFVGFITILKTLMDMKKGAH